MQKRTESAVAPLMDVEAEQSVIGGCLLDNAIVDLVAPELEVEDFGDPLHRRIIEMVYVLHAEGPFTPVLVNSLMRGDAGLAEVGGIAYLATLAEAGASRSEVVQLARVIKDLARRRDVAGIVEEAGAAIAASPRAEPTAQVIADAADRLLSLGTQTGKAVAHIGDVGARRLKEIEERVAREKRGEKPLVVLTGLRKFDKAIGGLMPGDRIGIAARTGMGKSSVASSLALGAAMNGAPVLICSPDMREGQWSDRLVCDMDRYLRPEEKPIHYRKFRTADFTADEWERVVLAQQAIAQLDIFVDDTPVQSVASIRGRTRSMARKYPGRQGVLVADFLQKIEASATQYRERRRDEDVTAVSYALGDIVRDPQVMWALLALIQLKNLETDSKGQLRSDPPTVAAIRESGGIEMSLDVIFSPFRPAFFTERREPQMYDPGGTTPTPDWLAWRKDYREEEHLMRFLGWKNRDGAARDLNLNLWIEAGSSAVRDGDPALRAGDVPDEVVQGLLPIA